MFQSRSVPAPPFAERVRTTAGRRAVGIVLTLLIEALLLFLFLTLGPGERPGREDGGATIVTLIAEDVAKESPEPPSPQPERQAQEQPQRPEPDQPQPPVPAPPAEPAAPPILPMRWQLPPAAAIPRSPAPPAPPARPVFGPADTRSAASRDSERVGTAPNGEPLYAAEWYREPDEVMLRNYLSTANGPGSGLIACRTAPDYRVEDCVALGEYPEGSQIARSVLAAAWEFRVRPARLGGRPLVGSWVRIRIDYDLRRR